MIASAIAPIPGAAEVSVSAPNPPNVKSIITSARDPNWYPKFSGTFTVDHFCMESANEDNAGAISAMAAAPNPDKVFSRPPKPVAPIAPAIADKPRPISSHDIEPNFCKESARSPSPWTPIRIAPLPRIPSIGAIFPNIPGITASSVSAPPIATSAFPMSSHDIPLNFCIASAISPSP